MTWEDGVQEERGLSMTFFWVKDKFLSDILFNVLKEQIELCLKEDVANLNVLIFANFFHFLTIYLL